MLHSYLVRQEFIQSQADNCVYMKIKDKSMTVVIIWVDDIIIASNCTTTLKHVKGNLVNRFQIKDMGKLSWFLGIEFTCKEGMIEINQTKYIESVLSRFNMQNCKPKSTPCEMNSSKVSEESSTPADNRLYREIVGSLVYIMTATRPDLCYTHAKIDQVDATLFVEQRLNNVIIKVQQHLLNSQC